MTTRETSFRESNHPGNDSKTDSSWAVPGVGIGIQNVPCSFDVANVVESLNTEAVVSDAVRQLRVCHRVKISSRHFTLNATH